MAIGSERIEKLRKSIQVEKYPICVGKWRLITESFKATEGQPQVIRNAKAIDTILNKIKIFIEDDELLVGNGASEPMGLELTALSGIWTESGQL